LKKVIEPLNSIMIKKISFVLLLIIGSSAYGRQWLNISGKVTDTKSNGISNAYIYILNTDIATFSDEHGDFTINNISPGEYAIVITAIGYATLNEKVFITKETGQSFVFKLADEVTELDAVIVTAQKREENLQYLPLSISVLEKKEIEAYRLWASKDLTAIAPNLYASNPGDGRNVISIRGVTSSSYDPAVTTYIDGVSQFTLDTYIPQLFDVARIEVLRGPQGTLYGRNAMGGIINIITKKTADKTEGFAEIDAGNYGMTRYTAGIRIPVIKNKLFFGAAFLQEGLDGYYFNTWNNSKFDRQHRLAGNYYLKYTNGSKWTATLNIKHLANRNYGAFSLAGNADYAFAYPFKINQNAVAKLIDNTINGSLSVNYPGKHVMISSQTAYQSNYRYYRTPIDADFSPIDGVTIINNYGHQWNNVKVITEEFKFSSPDYSSPLKWTAGIFMFYQKTPNKQATHFGKDAALVGSPDSNFAIINTTKSDNLGMSFFTQTSYAVNKKINIIAGVRYDHQYSKEKVRGDYQPDASPVPVFQTRPDTSAHARYGAFSPKLGIDFDFQKNTSVYITYSRGYRTGGLTQLSADPSQPPLYAYKPEFSNNFELGSKNMLFRNRLRANISFFYTIISDAQVPTLILPDAITVTKNAGSLNSKGFEMELESALLKGFEADYNLGYTYARYTRLKFSQNGAVTDLAGKRQIFTPDMTSLLAIQYGLPIQKRQLVKLILRGEWMYIGTTYFDFNNSIRQSPFNLLNTRIGITSKHFELMLWGRNLTDKKYIAYAYDFGAAHLGDPKTYGISIRTMF
jgi:iron complex outermembrane receptor protein